MASRSNLEQLFATRLRALRVEQGFTQAEVARKVGIAGEAYGRLERGAVLPRARTLAAIAQLLGTSVDYLLGLSEASGTAAALIRSAGSPKAAYLDRFPKSPRVRRLVRRLDDQPPGIVNLMLRILSAIERASAGRKKGRR